MKKTPLSLEDHAAQGRELKFIRDWLTSLSVKLGNAYPLKLHNLANRATVAVDKLRSAVPGMAFSSDFIVGFPGETDEDFALTRMAMEEVRYTSSFLFKYSPRPGTAAAALSDDVPCEVKKARHQELLALQNVLTLEVHQAQIGTEQEVLVEGPSKRNAQTLQGRTARYFNVVLPGDPAWAGTFRRVVFDRATTLTLYGKDTETPKT